MQKKKEKKRYEYYYLYDILTGKQTFIALQRKQVLDKSSYLLVCLFPLNHEIETHGTKDTHKNLK